MSDRLDSGPIWSITARIELWAYSRVERMDETLDGPHRLTFDWIV